MHLFTSRPFTLRALETLDAQIRSTSTIYFVTLTLATDILCTAFVIAVGNRQYKLFASRVLRKRLIDRKKAVAIVYFAFAKLRPQEDSDTVECSESEKYGFSYKDWVKVLVNMRDPKYTLTKEEAENIFLMEDVNLTGYVSINSFFRMMGSLESRLKFSVGSKEGQGGLDVASEETISTAQAEEHGVPVIEEEDLTYTEDVLMDQSSSPLHSEGSGSSGRGADLGHVTQESSRSSDTPTLQHGLPSYGRQGSTVARKDNYCPE